VLDSWSLNALTNCVRACGMGTVVSTTQSMDLQRTFGHCKHDFCL
jgi:hypothetical protein